MCSMCSMTSFGKEHGRETLDGTQIVIWAKFIKAVVGEILLFFINNVQSVVGFVLFGKLRHLSQLFSKWMRLLDLELCGSGGRRRRQ